MTGPRASTEGEGTGSPHPAQLSPGLYVVGTPIGNLEDITRRAVRVLGLVDRVVCEDRRVTGRLLTHLGLRKPLVSYHEHNAPRVRPALLRRLAAGERLALVCDAGMPLVADPGFRLVREALDLGIPVHAVPGPSAVTAALSVSGLPTDRFLFAGFLPARKAERRRRLRELAPVPATLVMFEAPHRLPEALADMVEILGPRPAAVARELTKLFEEVRRASLPELAAHYAKNQTVRGEVVVVVAPPQPAPAPDADQVREQLVQALAGASLREAVREVAARTGWPRREVYRLALALKHK